MGMIHLKMGQRASLDGVVKRNTSTLMGINPQSVVIQTIVELPS